MKIRTAFHLLLPLLLTGCVFRSAEPTRYYDLTLPDAEPTSPAPRLLFREFADRAGGGSRMLLRLPDGRMAHDGGCKWLLPPGELIPRTLTLLNRRQEAEDDAEPLTVKGTLLVFEADTEKNQFVLAGSFTLDDAVPADAGRPVFFRLAVPLDDRGGAAIARAASTATLMLYARILDRAAENR